MMSRLMPFARHWKSLKEERKQGFRSQPDCNPHSHAPGAAELATLALGFTVMLGAAGG